jgi:predicted aspartyl protease
LVVYRSGEAVRPFVRAKVAGQPMTLLLDTGASRSILPAAFVRRNKLGTRSSGHDEKFVDAHGNISAMKLLTDVPVQFEGETGAGTLDFFVNPYEGDPEGILSPQDMVRPGWVLVIDLGGEELRYEQQEAALKRLGEDASSPLRELDFHRCLAEGFFERSHRIVEATINGVSAQMLVDTGAFRTVLARNNPALASMLERKGTRKTVGAISSTGQNLVVEDVPVALAQTSFVLPILVEPVLQTCWQGLLGADILHHCTLVWGWSSLWAACRAPTGR